VITKQSEEALDDLGFLTGARASAPMCHRYRAATSRSAMTAPIPHTIGAPRAERLHDYPVPRQKPPSGQIVPGQKPARAVDNDQSATTGDP